LAICLANTIGICCCCGHRGIDGWEYYWSDSRSCLQCGLLSDVNMDSIHMVIDQRLGLDSIIVLHSRRSMKSLKPCDMYIDSNGTRVEALVPIYTFIYFAADKVGSGSFGLIFLIILAGLPATQVKSGTFFVTTLPAPTVTPLPIVTPGSTITLPPNQQSSPIVIGLPSSGPWIPFRRNGSSG